MPVPVGPEATEAARRDTERGKEPKAHAALCRPPSGLLFTRLWQRQRRPYSGEAIEVGVPLVEFKITLLS
jgi:hypothetical protein